jgi:hypothetical protein
VWERHAMGSIVCVTIYSDSCFCFFFRNFSSVVELALLYTLIP